MNSRKQAQQGLPTELFARSLLLAAFESLAGTRSGQVFSSVAPSKPAALELAPEQLVDHGVRVR
jgi:hypothetical protein